MKSFYLAIVAALLAAGSHVYAYPEMIRHAYTACTTCHISPDGGGLLSGYGRALSGEVLSTWHTETEAEFLYGAVKTPEFLSFGGHFRAVQTYLNNDVIEQGRFVFMQADLEAGAHIDKKFILVGTFGYDDTSGEFVSRRHYLRFQPDLKSPLYLRAGRFYPSYGIHLPDHVVWIRSKLDWGMPLREPYTFEASYLGAEYQHILSGFVSRPDDSVTDSGVSLSSQIVLSKTAKAGASAAYTARLGQNRFLFGPNASIGFTPEFFLLTEVGAQRLSNLTTGQNTWSAYGYARLDYEVYTGIHFYGVTEMGRSNFNTTPVSQGYGFGTQFFPRPHIELRAEYQRQRGDRPLWSDVAWVMGYYYL
jgi:hypothetical protein